MGGPAAPRDPEAKRPGFYIMRDKKIAGTALPDGKGTCFIYLDDGRMISSARIVGGITDEEMLGLLASAEGFRKMVHSIGISVETSDPHETVRFVFQMYGKTDKYVSGTQLALEVPGDGMEQILSLNNAAWSADDDMPGQIRFELGAAGELAQVSVCFYLNEGYDAPPIAEEYPVNFAGEAYQRMIERSLVQTGCAATLQRAVRRARGGGDVTIAFIGGSITQGAGATPINTACYAYRTYRGLCAYTGNDRIRFVKAGVGGTSSELGMVRYERDVLRGGEIKPDVVVVEYAVNDEGDETGGDCYEALIHKILSGSEPPAVILLFSVFANDWNLQERLQPIGARYGLPMVSIRDCVVEQFYGAERVVTKNQFFYDCYHPTNTGHQIMADALLHLMREADKIVQAQEMTPLAEIAPVYNPEFTNVRFFDRMQRDAAVEKLVCGSFDGTDTDLQRVEMDEDLVQTPEFPNNWMHTGGTDAFCLDIRCSALLIVYKDSASPNVGTAVVTADGEEVLRCDPHEVGWTHCHAQIVFRGRASGLHHVELRMRPGDEEKEFTILGFGYVA